MTEHRENLWRSPEFVYCCQALGQPVVISGVQSVETERLFWLAFHLTGGNDF